MSAHSSYDALRHFADSWGLVAMGLLFLSLIAWPFFFPARGGDRDAATMIFEDEDDGR